MRLLTRWHREPGARVEGSRDLDRSKVQAPGVVVVPSGGFRLLYTAVGPAKPFPECQGYILSAFSHDGLRFRPEPGIRVAPRPGIPHMSLRVLAPSVTRTDEGHWRMYFEARGPAHEPTVICSAVSRDQLEWEYEGVRLHSQGGVGAPRYVPLPQGGARLYCCASEYGPGGPGRSERVAHHVVSAVSRDGLDFEWESGVRLRDLRGETDEIGITAADVIPPRRAGGDWVMVYSAWQDVPPGAVAPPHPSEDVDAVASGSSRDFAAASIAADMAGYRSRIYTATSEDGLLWERRTCIVEGAGYGGPGPDAVHAEDMSVIRLGGNRYRMYYAACDQEGTWRVASAVTSCESSG